jgi:hypothetical protein
METPPQGGEMRKLLVAMLAAGSLVAMTVAPANAITKNYQADGVHTYVGLIGFYNGPDWEWSHRCTGELIAPNVVLTAGHCTDNEAGGVNDHARIWFEQNAGAEYTAANGEDPITGYPNECLEENLCFTSSEMYNYGFDNFAGYPNIHDVGIVILDRNATGLGLAELADPGTIDALRKARGTQDTTFGVSGYGISFSAKQGAVSVSFRVRLMAQESLVNTVSQSTDGYVVQLNGNGDSRGGTCSGDSGGPVFYPANSNHIVAVTSWGHSNAGCRGDGWYYRTDRQEVIDWINRVAKTHF